ncbi:hypothetical protein [Marinicella sp. W31]|uniref:hypothetical protein n=1 Tax=Marinicella sp. W31 TaxID=3023713 RepID=UPI003756E49E
MKQLLILLLVLLNFQVLAQIGISPRILDIEEADANSTHSFRLFNFSKKDYQVTVSLANWSMNENNVATVIAATEVSMDQWTIVNPLRFTITAGSAQTIRLAFQPPPDLAPGEYRTMVYFQQVLQDTEPQKKQLRSLFKLGAAVYLHLGEKQKTGVLNQVISAPNNWLLETQNTGNSHIRYKGEWYLWSAQPHEHTLQQMAALKTTDIKNIEGLIVKGELPTTPVLPGKIRNIPIDLGELDGSINRTGLLQIKGTLGDQAIDVFVPVN